AQSSNGLPSLPGGPCGSTSWTQTVMRRDSPTSPRGNVRKRVNEQGRCNLRFAKEPRARSTPEQKETPPVGKKSTESVAASSPTWETLEVFARQSMQQFLQRMLEEEVDGRSEERRVGKG